MKYKCTNCKKYEMCINARYSNNKMEYMQEIDVGFVNNNYVIYVIECSKFKSNTF